MDVGDTRPIKAVRPVTEADIEAASVPWSPGWREYQDHIWAEVVEGLGLTGRAAQLAYEHAQQEVEASDRGRLWTPAERLSEGQR